MDRTASPQPAPQAATEPLRRLWAVAFGVLVAASSAQPSDATEQWIRESKQVEVDGNRETWVLAWQHAPEESRCGPSSVYMAITCPCMGFGYAEQGDLVLTRQRPKGVPESMHLNALFGLDNLDNPVWEIHGRLSALVRWGEPKLADADRELAEDPKLISEIKSRQKPSVLNLKDYDRDGRATEFLLQVGNLPCGKHQYVAVGISKAAPRLHALTSVAHPDHPLILPLHAWDAVASGPGPHTVVTWECGDHGSDVHAELQISATDGAISGVNRSFSCPYDPAHPTLLGEYPL